MKHLLSLFLTLLFLTNVNSQVTSNSVYKSEIIKIVVIDSMWTRIDPLYNDTSSIFIVKGLDESLVMEKMVDALNLFRENYKLNSVSYNPSISKYLASSVIYTTPLDQGLTWGSYGLFTEYGYISNSNDIEFRFCQYLIDVMSVDEDLFKEITNPESKDVGVYFTQNLDDRSYTFMIFIK